MKILKVNMDFEEGQVFLVKGTGLFSLEEFFRRIGVPMEKYSNVRSHVFQGKDSYIATVLVQLKRKSVYSE